MEEKIFCLLTDRTIEIVDQMELNKYISNHDVEYLLIPVGVYSSEYCLVTPDILPYDIKKMAIEYKLCLQEFGEEDAIYEDIYENSTLVKIKKDGIIAFYKMIHSIYNINGVNALINSETWEEYTAFVFDYFKVHVKMGDRIISQDSRDVSMIEASPYATCYCDIASKAPYILFCIDHAMKRDIKKGGTIIPALSTKQTICIDIARHEWIETKSLKNVIKNSDNSDLYDDNIRVSVAGVNFNSMMFILPNDVRILNEFEHYSFGYMMLHCSQLDFDDSDIMASHTIQELYDNKLLDLAGTMLDSSIGLYELSTVAEVLNHFKYIFNTIQLINEKVYGICDRIIIYVSYSACKPKYNGKDFIYAVTNEDMDSDSNRDFFGEFINDAKYYLEAIPKKNKNENYEGWFFE